MRRLPYLFPPYGEDKYGAFWIGAVHLSSSGKIIGQLDVLRKGQVAAAFAADQAGNVYVALGKGGPGIGCLFDGDVNIDEYATTSQTHLLRSIKLGRVCSVSSIAADGRGDVFAAESAASHRGQATIVEYSEKNGSVKILRKIRIHGSALNLIADQSGNLYALIGAPTGSIVEYARAEEKPRVVLPGIAVSGFALSVRDELYAAVSRDKGNLGSIEVFDADSQRPQVVIAGPSTHFLGAMFVGITVRPR